MKKILRILFLLSPLIIVGLAYYEMNVWHPPLNPNIPQPVSIETLLEHNETYKAPMELIITGDVFNKSDVDEYLFLDGINDGYFKVNCTGLNISSIEPGMTLELRGYSFYDDPEKQYFVAIEFHIAISYSIYLSIPGAILILLILFWGFKFQIKDFSFSRKSAEDEKNA
ncbi:MAG TPA: hypothetical protein VMV49_14680 [Candidatus Deferrimicrobium sp.]|nr:hypothetical protein [Candidatus Deferrimicrobium sp.]